MPTAIQGQAAATYTGKQLKVYSAFGAEIDLVAESPDGAVPRWFMVLDAGAGTMLLGVTDANDVDTDIPAANLVSVGVPIGLKAIRTTTTVASVMVVW